jgi:uncharacterized membrane protein
VAANFRAWLLRTWTSFWLWPALLVVAGIGLGRVLVAVDRAGAVPAWLAATGWVDDGGGDGARALLGAVAGSTIGVAGTVFSITIAALSLAAGQMGPRLLSNFTRDRGNQVTLGILLGTFAHALVVLRTVRTTDEGAFVPHLALTATLLLALLSVATIVWFVGHMASRINVDTVMELVAADVERAVERLTHDAAEPAPARPAVAPPSPGATLVRDRRRGYLQDLDADAVADRAAAAGATVHLLVRPGDAVFPNAPFARIDGVDGAAAEALGRAIADATVVGPVRDSALDLEFAVRQLVEVAVRALSAGINDPQTAIGAIDRLGATLCTLATRRLASGVHARGGRAVLAVPPVDYDGLCDAMWHTIRQSGADDPSVMARVLEVLAAVRTCEADPARCATLRRHADLVLVDAERAVPNASDRADLRARHARATTETPA